MSDWDDFELPGVKPSAARVAEAQAKGDLEPPPFGEHVFVVSGFAGKPETRVETVYVNGYACAYNAMSIGVRLALPTNPGVGLVDWFFLPPIETSDLEAWSEGSKNPGDRPGFQSNRLINFVTKLGFAWEPGQEMPPEARKLANWKGRRVVAEVSEWKGKKQIALFSYRVAQPAGQGTAVQGHLPAARPAFDEFASAAPAAASTAGLEDL